ncbi:MAG: Imm26 family immunity protein [Bacillota bacterium]
MARKKIKAKVGDVFAIPINENLYCFGQIVAQVEPNPKLYVMFDFALDKIPEINSIINKPILAIAHMQDFAINDNEWPIIGNMEVALKNLKYPFYKIYKGNQMMVMDYLGKLVREANNKDLVELDFRTTFSSFDFESLAKEKFLFNKSMKMLEKDYSDILYVHSKWIKPSTDEIDKDYYFHQVQNQPPLSGEVQDNNNEKTMLTITFRIDGTGLNEPKNIEKRHYIEKLLDTCLTETGLGDCDGGEIGSDVMMIYCFVTDPEKAVNIIKEELKKAHLLDGAVITYR